MVSKRTQELIEKDLAHFFNPLAVVGQKPKLIWERGKGVKLWDTEGREYIDMTSGVGQCANLGFARRELNDAAHEQMERMSHAFIGSPYGGVPAIEYAAELAQVLPGDLNHVFFTCSGTESIETAIRVAKLYWHVRHQANKYKVICLSDAYHGTSSVAGGLMGASCGRNIFGPEPSGLIRVPNYHCYRCPFGLKYPTCNMLCARFVERVITQEGEDSIACMVAEPVQGVAGIVWPRDEYWPIVRKICSDHNILLIADEVQNAFCRTGKFWGVDNWNIIPDMMAMGKGINSLYIPFGAVGVSDRVYNEFQGQLIMLGGTASGHPVGAATARAALKIYIEEKLAERAARLGEHMRERVLNEILPLPCVVDALGRGLYQSFAIALNKSTASEFNPDAQAEAADIIFERMREGGVFVRIEHNRRMYLTPPLVIGEDELDKALDTIRDVMAGIKPV